MATLSQMCSLPDGWDTLALHDEQSIGMSEAKWAIKMANKARRERMRAYYERERKRNKGSQSMSESRKAVYRETIAEPIALERGGQMFAIGKGQRSAKKAKNGYSKEQAGTIGSMVVTKRFSGSRLTCVCKCKSI